MLEKYIKKFNHKNKAIKRKITNKKDKAKILAEVVFTCGVSSSLESAKVRKLTWVG